LSSSIPTPSRARPVLAPHHTQLQSCGRKRKAEHLAGRIAAVHALREYGIKTVPGIGGQRQPLWPQKLFGSISHSTSTALAVVSTHPVGLDIEAIFTPQTAVELTGGIIDNSEQRITQLSPLPFPLALTWRFPPKRACIKHFRAGIGAAGFCQRQNSCTHSDTLNGANPRHFAKPRRTGS
jgi:enterobactin synthetase component D